MTRNATGRRSAGGDNAPGAWTIAWLGVAAVVYVASVVDLVRAPLPTTATVSGVVLMLGMVSAGAIIVLRTDVPLLGWLLVASGATINFFSAADNVAVVARTDAELVWLSIIGFSPTFLLAAIILFPTGRVANRFAQVVLIAFVGSQVLSHGLQLANAVDVIGGEWADYRAFGDTALALTVFAVVVMHAVTYRRRPRTEQLQLKYLIVWLAFASLSFLFSGSGGALNLFDDGVSADVQAVLDILGPGLVPVAIVLAMTRYRLYEIDRFISRTLAYALVLGLLGGLFVGGVALITGLLPAQDRLAVVLTTLVVVALFDPLRRRVTSAVDRRFDRTRYVARQVAEDFGRQVQDVTDVGEVVERVHAVVGTTLAPATVAVWQPTTEVTT